MAYVSFVVVAVAVVVHFRVVIVFYCTRNAFVGFNRNKNFLCGIERNPHATIYNL